MALILAWLCGLLQGIIIMVYYGLCEGEERNDDKN